MGAEKERKKLEANSGSCIALTTVRSSLKPLDQGVIRNQFRIETTETGTETSFGTIRNKTFVSVVSL